MKFIIIPLEYSEDAEHEQACYAKFNYDLRKCLDFKSAPDENINKTITLIYKTCKKSYNSHIIVDVDASIEKCIVATKTFGNGNKWDLSSFFINEHVSNVDNYTKPSTQPNKSNKKSEPKEYDIDDLLSIIAENGVDALDDDQKRFLDDFSNKH